MKIGEIAAKTGVSRDTIRLYESRGMLKGVTRPHEYNNYKDYSEQNLERVRLILVMKKLGLTLNECQAVMEMMDNDEFEQDQQQQFIQKKLDDIDQKIRELQEAKQLLEGHLGMSCNQDELVGRATASNSENEPE
ncbi:MerR family transcriptional regulator [bacterium SCSIO 12741]|nr:MerR family transcriptional regulator [bacterium SCSIO 12741]